MKTVINNENTLTIKNSKFICIIYKLNNISDINTYLKEVKTKYKDATHYCYAYIFNNTKKETDDGEPSGTAGIPIMQVLEKNNLNMTLAIVIRYFGGIKLGTGGLVRAYTKSVTECLKNHTQELKEGYNITITFNYKDIKNIDYLLNSSKIITKTFKEKITYNINLNKDTLTKLKQIPNTNITINKDIYL